MRYFFWRVYVFGKFFPCAEKWHIFTNMKSVAEIVAISTCIEVQRLSPFYIPLVQIIAKIQLTIPGFYDRVYANLAENYTILYHLNRTFSGGTQPTPTQPHPPTTPVRCNNYQVKCVFVQREVRNI